MNDNLSLLLALANSIKQKDIASLMELKLNTMDMRAVHVAASKGQNGILKWLIMTGGASQLESRDGHDNITLHAAANNDDINILNINLEHVLYEELFSCESNQGEVPLIVAAMNQRSAYFNRAVHIILDMKSSRKRSQLLKNVLDRFLRYCADAVLSEPILGALRTFVTAALDLFDSVKWNELVENAIDDDAAAFFEIFLDHLVSRQEIQGILKSASSSISTGSTLLHKACTITEKTKPRRARIVQMLLEVIPDEITWGVEVVPKESARKGDGKVIFSSPLTLALTGVASSDVAVEVVSILSTQLLILAQQRKFIPQLIREIGQRPETNLDNLELLTKIRPDSVRKILTCGALNLQQHFIDQPKNNIFHAAILQDDCQLLENLYQCALQETSGNLKYSLRAPSDSDEKALTLTISMSKIEHALFIVK